MLDINNSNGVPFGAGQNYTAYIKGVSSSKSKLLTLCQMFVRITHLELSQTSHKLPLLLICPWCDIITLLNGKSHPPGVTAIALLLLSSTSLSLSSASRA